MTTMNVTENNPVELKQKNEEEKLNDFVLRNYIKQSQKRQTIMIEMVPMKPRSKPAPPKKVKAKPAAKTQVNKVTSTTTSANKKKISYKNMAPLMAQCRRIERNFCPLPLQ